MEAHYENILLALVGCLHLLGIMSGLYALFTARSSQGAIAWIMSMVTFPYLAVPLYWIFGRNRFQGYVRARREGDKEIETISRELKPYRSNFDVSLDGPQARFQMLEKLAKTPIVEGNHAQLLINGDATFEAIFKAMDQARDYILVQFFIIHDDRIGRDLKEKLLAKAAQGVRIFLLYDEIGSHKLPTEYVDELLHAGVDARAFHTTKGWRNQFQINFRNHRKIVVVDGKVAFVGGLNVGDEYMGRDPKFGKWRDTHCRFEGPCVTLVQLSFMEDWYWSAHTMPKLDWTIRPSEKANMPFLTLPTGPADELESCNLFFTHAIHRSRKRIWIVSPYFVPGDEVIAALQLAALRGVDVRVMLPLKPDHKVVYMASFSYLPELESLGVKFYRYQPGFLHQKIILVDDAMASVGTANCDNRSFRLNFEISMVGFDPVFVRSVEEMLEQDFAQCVRCTAEEYTGRWIGFKAAVRVARLFAPIL
ncbi:MAG: cardiolipin synthase [Desulfovibrio sp.]|uniref:cardiolipin synthase n=1 Tax=Desulfovibrio sp. 7SRBS1 TaxID=3378064 RepID=UPI003B3DC9F0